MLHDLDKTFDKILVETGKINKREIDISFEQPTGEWSARLNRPTLNCWCFDLRENVKLRNPEWRVSRNGDRGRRAHFPRRMNLTYLVTAWARKIEDEHRLLWRALGTLKRFEALDPADCEGDLRYQEHKIPIWVADMSEHGFNLVDLWSVLENQMRLGFIVVATVELDTEFGIEAPLVLDATVRVGQSDTPSERRTTAVDVELRHTADETAEEGDEYD